MKELIVVIGLVVFGAVLVNTFVLGDTNSLQTAASSLLTQGNAAVEGIQLGTGN